MDKAQYLKAINAPGVNMVGVEWTSEVRPAAAHKARVLRKVTTAVALTGVEYAGMSANNDRTTGPLPWGTWQMFPYVIEHKGTEYARLYTQDHSVRTIYTVDGLVVRRDEFLTYLTPSQRGAARPHAGCVTVKMSNVRLIGEPVVGL